MKKIYVEFGHLELEGDEEKYTKFEDKLDKLSDMILDELSGESVEPSGNKRIDEIISGALYPFSFHTSALVRIDKSDRRTKSKRGPS